jgi:multisubunit Na+/H+ antiporter MnhG subunit
VALTLIAASAGTAGVAVALLAVLGLLAMPSPLARLHFLTPAATITPVLLGLAAAAHQSFGSGAVKPALVAVLMVVTAPVLTHATGRALSEDRR